MIAEATGIIYLEGKRLDGAMLRLKTWVSDFIEPGRRMFELELVRGNGGASLTTQFPTRYEDYNRAQVQGFYEEISSIDDFNKLRRKFPE